LPETVINPILVIYCMKTGCLFIKSKIRGRVNLNIILYIFLKDYFQSVYLTKRISLSNIFFKPGKFQSFSVLPRLFVRQNTPIIILCHPGPERDDFKRKGRLIQPVKTRASLSKLRIPSARYFLVIYYCFIGKYVPLRKLFQRFSEEKMRMGVIIFSAGAEAEPSERNLIRAAAEKAFRFPA